MEYLGVQLEESEAWIISSFAFVLKTMKEEKALTFNEEQKTLLFVTFYAGVLKGRAFEHELKEG